METARRVNLTNTKFETIYVTKKYTCHKNADTKQNSKIKNLTTKQQNKTKPAIYMYYLYTSTYIYCLKKEMIHVFYLIFLLVKRDEFLIQYG